MAVDPVNFVTADCTLGKVIQSSITQQKKAFLNANAGLSSNPVSIGLGVLAQVSTAIRIGQQSIPGITNPALFGAAYNNITSLAPNAISQGGNAVLTTIGVSPSAASAITNINPPLAVAGITQAQNVFSLVKSGNFSSANVATVAGDLQNLSTISGKLFSGLSGTADTVVRCGANPYAMDLIARGPKPKFMFVVQFTFNAPYSTMFDQYGRGTAFVIKQSTRPKIDFEYDDVNMYNFRTKVPKRTIYNPMSMTFYDDDMNNVTNFYNAYLTSLSPIANGGKAEPNGTVTVSTTQSPQIYAIDSMNDTLSDTQNATASFGPLKNNNITLIQSIKLFHIYNYGKYMTVYNFFNPKITTLAPDDLTMIESGNGSEMQFEFVYDSLVVVPSYSLQQTAPYNITDLTKGGLYQIQPAFGGSGANQIVTNVNKQVTQQLAQFNAVNTPQVTAPTLNLNLPS